MRIGAISDLHVDRHNVLTSEDYLAALVVAVNSKHIDILLLAGDIANHFEITTHFIQRLTDKIDIPVLFVPGNHDFWQAATLSTPDILAKYQQLDQCLINQPYIANEEWAIVGHTAWYDYSYANDKFSLEQLESGKHYGATWQDKEKISWGISDQRLSRLAAEQVEQDIKKVGNRKIILMTHMVTHHQFVVPTPHRIFDFYNAYIGTSDFDDIYHRYHIPFSIMGHVHFRKVVSEQGTTFMCPCLGYPRQWRTNDIQHEMVQTLMTFEI
ncbi:metallophosphoesterase [Staphylococcus simiae]|uniref:metallophosphoesterase n=1 Tax=Staphylococcus simiae TaxID=308354 RepID=UPI001A96C3BB|nr:metallophosphoesterase [Staphylococcus simiae]MBO1198550.1 metallophosphoesterase [Staphylococcus simiae]MBO1200652.1 metallophosphoesterase [Staphylococcus simiae]MBO1202956.1 metallophosphoesterase [Staphylococcus simiae]MBO1210541.1 metallophosphoesterase [Staphylococcus simiae]MBO1229022.1 metallophosphoesterase [Staphylococcus simiae]